MSNSTPKNWKVIESGSPRRFAARDDVRREEWSSYSKRLEDIFSFMGIDPLPAAVRR